jgi:AcrR family transcriptional regulator
VLTAAADLIERWGYDKTTVDDIARAAGVAKGTIYLHWKTRDAVFVAVLRRERVLMLRAVSAGLAADPLPGPRTLFRLLAAAVLDRPLVRAVLLNDLAILGKLADRQRSDTGWRTSFADYLETLREHGAVRADWDDRHQVNFINATFMGLLTTAALMPQPMRLTEAEQADLVGETIARTLLLDEPADPAAVARATTKYFDAALAVAQRELDEATTPSEGGA